MEWERKLEIITRNLEEVVGKEDLEKILKERDLKLYWGTAPTGPPHFGYYVPMRKVADFLKAGCDVTILFADIHASLDNLKSTFDVVQKRTKYYELVIKSMLKASNVPLEKLHFVTGSSFQLTPPYSLDVLKLSAQTSIGKAKHSGTEVVKQSDEPLLSGLLYPLLQSLDEEYLKVDCQFGGVDQRKIFMLAREVLPRLGYKKRVHLMNALIPGLGKDGKMSSSIPSSVISFMDEDDAIRKKISKAYSIDGDMEKKNCLLCMLKYVIFPQLEESEDDKRKFIVERKEKFGGRMVFSNYEEVEESFRKKELFSGDLKIGVAEEIIKMVKPVREEIQKNISVFHDAYGKKYGKNDEEEEEEGGEEQVEKKKFIKKAKKKEKKEKHRGYEMFLETMVQEKGGEFPGLKGKKLTIAVRKKYSRDYGKLSKEEKDELDKKWKEIHKEE